MLEIGSKKKKTIKNVNKIQQIKCFKTVLLSLEILEGSIQVFRYTLDMECLTFYTMAMII